jgi:hypothetical protein
MGSIEGDLQPVVGFAFSKIDAGMMVEFMDDIVPLTLAKALDGQFPAQQKSRLIGCFMRFDHDRAPRGPVASFL